MTEKTLSQEICEICGVEPHYLCKNVPCLNFISPMGICNISEKRCNPCTCEDNYDPDTNHRNWKEGIAIYPDFTLPENFVKLFNLKIEHPSYSTVGRVMTELYKIENTEYLIERLVYELDCYHQLGVMKYIKQAIKEAEWIY